MLPPSKAIPLLTVLVLANIIVASLHVSSFYIVAKSKVEKTYIPHKKVFTNSESSVHQSCEIADGNYKHLADGRHACIFIDVYH